tara:strand:+ start:63 stop:200 length:138 start_codon:yes stop_codon:yes gene_type:complete
MSDEILLLFFLNLTIMLAIALRGTIVIKNIVKRSSLILSPLFTSD